MKTFAILHGWAGGRSHVRHFCKELNMHGFEITKNPRGADIVIAHSTGCYRVKENSKAKLVLLIGPPYWPGQNVLKRLVKKTAHAKRLNIGNRGYVYTFHKFIWEVVYVIIKPGYTFIALKNHRYLHFLDLLEGKKAILVRNEMDYFCSPEIEKAIRKYPNVQYISLPGGHDDFMTNPGPYINLILKELSQQKIRQRRTRYQV